MSQERCITVSDREETETLILGFLLGEAREAPGRALVTFLPYWFPLQCDVFKKLFSENLKLLFYGKIYMT